MKASDNFKIQGYLQLFMAFWPKGHPDVKFYMAMNFDFTKPVTEDVLKTFLEASGKLCEEQNPALNLKVSILQRVNMKPIAPMIPNLTDMSPGLEMSKNFLNQNSDIKTQFRSVQSGIFFTKKFFIILHINFRGNIQAIERRKV